MEEKRTGKGGGADETRPAAAARVGATSGTLTNEEGAILLRLARQSLEESVRTGNVPRIDVSTMPQALREMKGCFVTLTEAGQLRGCIGHIFPRMPLCMGVIENARSAALQDPRFATVRPDELPRIHVEVSVLTAPEPLAFDGPDDLLAKLQPHRDGVVLDIGGRTSTFLPQVWEQLPDKATFLNHLSQKSGCAASAWRGPGVTVKIYHAQAFEEPHK